LIELLKQKNGGENSAKLEEIKQFQGKFLNKKIATDANKFKLAVDSALDMVVIVDKFGYINYVNSAVTAITGISLSDAENKKITELWHREDDVDVWKQNYEKVSNDKKSIVFTAWGYKPENIKFESEIKISPIKNPDDTVDNFLVVERDVTEEKQKERIKTEFISVVSHELRTPMTVIRGYSALLSDGKLGVINDKQKEYIDKINSETGRLLELANDMLDLQKFESGKIELKFEKTNMPKFMQKIVEDFQMQYAKKGFTLELENNLKSEFANIDVKYFERVITNLLTNAYKYTEKGGVKVFLVNPDPSNMVIAVKDTGVGIKEAALPHLFERFYQAQGVMQRKQEGSGLGLSIVKTVAEAHNGMVWVESKEGVGSTFYVAIPLAD
jgi:PAS domain S-box-containing protein